MNTDYNSESRDINHPGDTAGELAPGAQEYTADFPIFRQLGRTGASRYSPTVRNDKFGRVFTYSPDSISAETYDEMRFDAQIRAGLNLIKHPIIQCPWSIQCEDPDIASFSTQVLTPIWGDFIRQSLLALDFGFSVSEKVWGAAYNLKVSQTQGQLADSRQRVYPHADVLKKFMALDPSTLYLLAYRWSGDFAGVRQFLAGSATIPANKCFIFSNDMEFQEWYGISRMKPCYPYWIFKRLMYEYANVHYETWSMPMKKGRYPVGKTENGVDGNGNPTYILNSDAMMGLLEELRSNFSIGLPANRYENGQYQWDVDLLENSSSGSDHINYINHLDLMILKGLLVPQLALEIGSSGSHALAEVQMDTFIQNIQSIMNQLESALNTQVLGQLGKYNFGASAPQQKFKFLPIDNDVKEGLINVFMQTIGSGRPIPLRDGSSLMPDWQWMADNLGVPTHTLTKEETLAYDQYQAATDPQTQYQASQAQGGTGDQQLGTQQTYGPTDQGAEPMASGGSSLSRAYDSPAEEEDTRLSERWFVKDGVLCVESQELTTLEV